MYGPDDVLSAGDNSLSLLVPRSISFKLSGILRPKAGKFDFWSTSDWVRPWLGITLVPIVSVSPLPPAVRNEWDRSNVRIRLASAIAGKL